MSLTDHAPFIHLALLLAVALLPALWRSHPSARAAGALASVFGCFGLLFLWMRGPYAIPLEGFTFLKEGREEAVLHALWDHEGWFGWAVPEWVLPLRATVFLHVMEAVAALALLVPIARTFTTRLGAAAVVMLVALNPWFLNAAHSEGHAIPILLATFLGALVAGTPRDTAPLTRLTASAALTLTAAAAAALRIETLLVSGPVVAASLAAWCLPVSKLDARLRASSWPVLGIALLVTTTATLALMYAVGDWMPATTTVRVAAPWAPATWQDLRLPHDLLAFSSPGLTVLVLLGMVAGVRDLRSFALAFGTLLSSRVYSQASHLGAAPYETLRYVAMLLGPMSVLALLAAHRLDGHARARAIWPWLAIGSVALPRVLAPAELRGPPWALAHSVQQVGARFIVETVEANRGCLFETRLGTRVSPGKSADDVGALTFETATYGWPLREGSPQLGGDGPADTDCLLFVRALDCNLPGAGCAELVGDQPAREVRSVTAPESNLHHGRRASPATFSVTPLN